MGVLGAACHVLAAVSIASIVGLADAIGRIQENGYLPLGFHRSAAWLLTERVATAALLGLLLAAACVLAGFLRDRLAAPWIAGASPPAGGPGADPAGWARLLPYAGCFAVALASLGLRAVLVGAVASHRIWLVCLASGFWCVAFLALFRARWTREFLPGNLRHNLGALFFGGSALFLLALLFLSVSDLQQYMGRFEIQAGMGVSFLIVLLFIVFYPGDDVRARRVGGAGLLRRPALWLVLAPALLPLLLAAAPAFVSQAGAHASNPKNVILIGIDTLRKDHTMLGPEAPQGRDVTPNMRELAGRGTVFQGAVSQAPWTMASFGSVLTGLYPRQHGAYPLDGYLRESETTLAEILNEAGYETGGVVSVEFIDDEHGFAQGMDSYNDENCVGRWDITSEGVTDGALSFLDGVGERPFFLFVHYFDPHFEYRNHAKWGYADSYRGWLSEQELEIMGLRHSRHNLVEEDVDYLVDLYDEEIAYVDSQVGRLLDYVSEQGLMEETAIVLLADHGEEFMEHGWLGHTIGLWDQHTRVPLAFVLPGETLVPSVERTVETRSVFETLLKYLQVDFEAPDPGRSLLPLARGEKGAGAGSESLFSAYSEIWLPDAPINTGKIELLSSLRTDSWKLIFDHRRGLRQLFDLRSDPGENVDLSAEGGEVFEEMSEALDEWLRKMATESKPVPHQAPSKELMERLKSLGYI
jgi:arylsulfatase A-like enzyme